MTSIKDEAQRAALAVHQQQTSTMHVAALRRSIATVEALGRWRPSPRGPRTTSAQSPLLSSIRSFTQTTPALSVAPKRPSAYGQTTATRANTGPPPTTERTAAANPTSSSSSIPVSSSGSIGAHEPTTDNILHSGLADRPQELEQTANGSGGGERVDWTRSFHGISSEPFPKEVADVLLAPIDPDEVEIKPDGIVYLPEIKYRRILNKAFGPGGWGLVPRSESIVTPKTVTREYALICNGRYDILAFPNAPLWWS